MRSTLFTALVLFASNALATTYGDTTYNYNASVTPCVDTVGLSLPLSVSVPSRINISARATYYPNGSSLSEAIVYAVLRDSGNTTTLATSQSAYSDLGSNLGGKLFVHADGLLHTGTSDSDPNSTIYVAAPGNYLLTLHLEALNGTSCTGSPYFYQPTLSYILLSSAFDRIFADGFEAMLSDGASMAVVA